MKPDETLDLCGLVDPYCLILCKATLAHMRQGGTLEICIRDPDTMKDLLTILERSGEVLLGSEKRGDRFHLFVRKCSASIAKRKGEKDVERGSGFDQPCKFR